jgi:Fur family transcriptional regulator, zinc uptake regulator
MQAQRLADRFGFKITALRADVLQVFLDEQCPLKAYDILAKLKLKRANAEPPTVYRILDFLLAYGVIHRLDSQNTYMLCDSSHQHAEELHVIMLCDICHEAVEVCAPKLQSVVDDIAAKKQFLPKNHSLEVQGVCKECQNT